MGRPVNPLYPRYVRFATFNICHVIDNAYRSAKEIVHREKFSNVTAWIVLEEYRPEIATLLAENNDRQKM